MSKVIRRLRWLLGYKPLQIATALPERRECVWVGRTVATHGRMRVTGWGFRYSDGTAEWVSEARRVTE